MITRISVVLLLAVLLVFTACSSPATMAQSKLRSSEHLITEDASQFALAISDFEPGWTQSDSGPTTQQGAQSAYQSYFYQGIFYPPVIQNTVAVYSSVDLAQQVYLSEVPKDVSLENPKIGDESFLDISIPIFKRLIFRKNNVVVWIWLQQDTLGDIKPYAKIIEGKIR